MREQAPERPMDSDCWLPDVLFERWRRSRPRPPLEPVDLAEHEGRGFVHALLPFPLETGEAFRVGLWLEVDPFTLRRVRRARAREAAWLGCGFEGRIANDIRLFGVRLLGAAVEARPLVAGVRPVVLASRAPALAALMRRGWTEAEYRRVVGAAGAGEEGQGRVSPA